MLNKYLLKGLEINPEGIAITYGVREYTYSS